jgi:lysozyme
MKAKEFITKHEGRRNKPYKCPVGFKTIGIGWNMDSRQLPQHIADYLKENKFITDEMIDELFLLSLKTAKADCKYLFPEFAKFSKNRQIALTDFVFQLGRTKAMKFVKAIAAINTGYWYDAAGELENSNWYKQTTKRADEIIDMIIGG